jgi:hypothetical protein
MVTSSWLAGGVRSWGKRKSPLSRRECRRATQASIGGVTTAIHSRSLSRMCRHSVDGLLSPRVACTRFSRARTSWSVSIRSLVSRPPLRLSLGYLAGLSIFSPSTTCTRLVVEEPDALLDKRDAQLLRRLEHLRVVLAPARRRDVLGPGAPRSVDVIRERELLD